MEKKDLLIVFLIGVLVVAVGALVANFMPAQSGFFTGRATEVNTDSTVTIENYIAISMNTNLSNGIDFGTVSALPTDDQNASNNNFAGGSGYNILLSADSNYNATICVNGTVMNTSNGDEIGLANYTWNDSLTTTDANNPTLGTAGTALTAAAKNGTPTMGPGTYNYYRFQLDIPASTNPGIYNNTVYFKAARTGQDACGSVTK